jgi:hypothetical protein
MIKKIGLTGLMLLVVTTLTASPVLAQAETYTESERYPVHFEIWNPCTEEDVLIDGYFHEMFHVTVSEDGRLLLRGQLNPQNVVGVGLDTGAQYRFSGTVNEVDHFAVGTGAETYTFIDQHHFIAKGVSENTVMQETVHFTRNANGEMTSALENLILKCQ